MCDVCGMCVCVFPTVFSDSSHLPFYLPLTCSVQLSWERVRHYSTDLDSNTQPDRMYLTLSCESRVQLL